MRVLIAVDGSQESRDAVTAAYRYFGSDAEYSVLSVAHRPPVFVGGYGAALTPAATDLERQLDTLEQAARGAALDAQAQLPDSADVDVEVGHAGEAICDYATEHRVDVIAIGSHDKTIWERIFEPSVGRHLIDHAPCAVLVIRGELGPKPDLREETT